MSMTPEVLFLLTVIVAVVVGEASPPQVAVTLKWKLINISHHNVAGAKKAEREIERFLQEEVAHKVSAPALVDVRIHHPVEGHIDLGLELLEQADPEMREFLREWASDIKTHILEGTVPHHTSPVAKAIAKVPRQPAATPGGGLRRLGAETCLDAEMNTVVAILNVLFSVWGLSQRGVQIDKIASEAARGLPKYISGWAMTLKTIIDSPIKGVVSFLGSIWTSGGWSVITAALKGGLSSWDHVIMGVQLLAQVASWFATGWVSFLALAAKLVASTTGLILAAVHQQNICNQRRLGAPAKGDVSNAHARDPTSHTDTITGNVMHFSNVWITVGPIPEAHALKFLNVFNRVPGDVEVDITKSLSVLPSIKLLQDGPIEVLVSHPAVVEATCESEVCMAGFELDSTKLGVTCGHHGACAPLDDTERCCKVVKGGSNAVAGEQLMTFDLSLANINYDNVMSQSSIRIDQVKNSIKNGVVVGSGNLVTTAAIDVSLSKEMLAMRARIRMNVSALQYPQKVMSAVTSDGSYNMNHGVVNSLLSLRYFDQLRTGAAFVNARMETAPVFARWPPHRRLQDFLV